MYSVSSIIAEVTSDLYKVLLRRFRASWEDPAPASTVSTHPIGTKCFNTTSQQSGLELKNTRFAEAKIHMFLKISIFQ